MISPFASSHPAYYINYCGGIYNGIAYDLSHNDKVWFVMPRISLRELRSLKPKERTLEKYRELGWEIRDNDMIDWGNMLTDVDIGTRDSQGSYL